MTGAKGTTNIAEVYKVTVITLVSKVTVVIM
jgi:hypothetical protein